MRHDGHRKDIEMTRDEAEEIIMAVEVGFGDHYGITRSKYAEALLIVSDDATEQVVVADIY